MMKYLNCINGDEIIVISVIYLDPFHCFCMIRVKQNKPSGVSGQCRAVSYLVLVTKCINNEF